MQNPSFYMPFFVGLCIFFIKLAKPDVFFVNFFLILINTKKNGLNRNLFTVFIIAFNGIKTIFIIVDIMFLI